MGFIVACIYECLHCGHIFRQEIRPGHCAECLGCVKCCACDVFKRSHDDAE